jgi:hypothetical protein
LDVSVSLEITPVACRQLPDIRERGAQVREAFDVRARGQSEIASRSMRSRGCSWAWLNPLTVVT